MDSASSDGGPTLATSDCLDLAAHPLRAFLLHEIHARPFQPLAAPRCVTHFAFTTDTDQAARDRAALAAYCRKHGVAPPENSAKHHSIGLGEVRLRWEQHSEFTTYSWDFPADGLALTAPCGPLAARMRDLPQPGPLLVAIDLRLTGDMADDDLAALFDPATLAMSRMDRGGALVASDFKVDDEGFLKLVVVDRGLGPNRGGALSQRLLELETYRMLSLLGLPQAQALAGPIREIEQQLTDITAAMTRDDGFAANRKLLDDLARLGAALEAHSSASLYRFGASRAYYDIVQGRLGAIGEEPCAGRATFAGFFARRLAPAMRTCQTLEDRQGNLSRKLARAIQLLATRVELDLAQQNRDLLSTMNRRTQLQLRLQQTVEGLSIVAISYYILGILGYPLKGLAERWPGLDTTMTLAVAVPLVLAAVGLVVVSIRNAHREPPA